jgi:alpha-L-fucosidase
MPSHRGAQFVNLNVSSARYVRLVVNSMWAASSASKFHNQLRIDEMWLGSDFA